ncbi:hypothetical protein BHE74_00054112 [Ensete ventricosum]|nr:hypothetical protein BHE74_00054112 [Ensete ventricosum]RZS07425.1 hypothetical protein BHM03_00038259 [Ensete ventricosum]
MLLNILTPLICSESFHIPLICSELFDVEVANCQILKCDQRCPRMKLLREDQEIPADFFLFPLDDYEVMLNIEWLTR